MKFKFSLLVLSFLIFSVPSFSASVVSNDYSVGSFENSMIGAFAYSNSYEIRNTQYYQQPTGSFLTNSHEGKLSWIPVALMIGNNSSSGSGGYIGSPNYNYNNNSITGAAMLSILGTNWNINTGLLSNGLYKYLLLLLLVFIVFESRKKKKHKRRKLV